MSFVRHLSTPPSGDERDLREVLDILRNLCLDSDAATRLVGQARRRWGATMGSDLIATLTLFGGCVQVAARRTLRLGPCGSPRRTSDERNLLYLLAAHQNGRNDEVAIRCLSLFKPAWQGHAKTTSQGAAWALTRAGVHVPAMGEQRPRLDSRSVPSVASA